MQDSWLSQVVVVPLLALLACTAVTVVRMRDLWAAVMLTGVYSFLGAGWMLVLDAPDVAFTEAAVGAGISTVLMLSTLALTSRTAKPPHFSWVALIVVLITGAALVYGTLDMPHYGDPNAPIHRYPVPSYVERTPHEVHMPNVVTAVLASYRGYDTLGETTVIFTAGVAVMLLLQGKPTEGESRFMKTLPILRVVTKLLIPYILLFALYVQFHGDFGPGGGFQAGVILAAAVILYGLVFDLHAVRGAIRPVLVEGLLALGVLIFGGTGLLSLLANGNFLDYDVLEHSLGEGFLPHGQHLGIFLVELGVGITVSAVMISIFYAFAGRGRAR